jgi:hypothetical protein
VILTTTTTTTTTTTITIIIIIIIEYQDGVTLIQKKTKWCSVYGKENGAHNQIWDEI